MLRTLTDGLDGVLVIEQAESLDLVFQAITVSVDGNGVRTETVVNPQNLLSLTVTLFNEADGAVINSRNAQNILGANGGSIVSTEVRLRLQPVDNPIVDTDLDRSEIEYHVARFSFTWSDGVLTRTGIEEVRFGVRRVTT